MYVMWWGLICLWSLLCDIPVEVESEGEPENYSPGAIIVQDSRGDYLLEDKSQLGGIIDFKKVPRHEADRQQARRDLVIQMLIAESMSKWDKLYRRVKKQDMARKRADRARLMRDELSRLSIINDMSSYYWLFKSKVNMPNFMGVGNRHRHQSQQYLDDTSSVSRSHLYI